jgi:uncharacterized protein YeaO (DUF488 family)
MLKIKRVYDEPVPEDGIRILVDRIWPRGISKERAKIDEWRRDIAVSSELRKWYGHNPAKWDEFRRRYRQELEENNKLGILRAIAERAKKENVTLVFGAKDVEHSNASFLRELISQL